MPNVQLLDGRNVGDTHLYRTYGENVRDGRIPYDDFYVEYPPGAIPAFVAPTAGDRDDYRRNSVALQWLLTAACVVLIVVVLAPVARSPRELYLAAGLLAISPVLLGRVTFTRFDFWPATLTLAALALAVRSRHVLSAVMLAAATAAKVYPAVLLPLFLFRAASDRGRDAALRAIVALVATIALILVPFAIVGAGGLRFTLTVQLERPLQVESLGSSVLLALDQLELYDAEVVSSHGSDNLAGSFAGAVATATSLAGLAALIAICLWFRASRRVPAELLTASAAAVTVFVAFGRVLSPQYLIWLVALVPLARGRRGAVAAALVLVAAAVTQVWAQGRYGDVVDLEPVVWAVLVRNALLVAAAAVLLLEVARYRRT